MDSLRSWVANEDNLTRIAEGKTKVIYKIKEKEDYVLIRSKDQLTAFNAARKNVLEGKAQIANRTTVNVFKLLTDIGVPSHFVTGVSGSEFIAKHCEMIPIEWVARRIATGSFLKRNPGVPQGYRFDEPKIETFFKDDANDDPQYSDEQILCSNFEFNGVKIGKTEINLMKRMTSVIFKVLERCWAKHYCSLVDMKVEYGVTTKGEIVLADVIDNDSWRVWPLGNRGLQLDKQFYRDMKEVTPEGLQQLTSNYEKVMEITAKFSTPPSCRALIIMGSPSDQAHCDKIAASCRSLGIKPIIRVSSAHKTTHETLDIVAEYDDDETPTVAIAVAGRSNGLGPVIAGNFTLPVINCPPLTEDNMTSDVWSSLRMPSGLGCSTVIGADEAALCAAKLFAWQDHMVYGKILGMQLNNAIKISKADRSSV
uniref:AIRC domain-containing protein n=1 Tax=Haemonchus contortus TaxID=6289 RepID=A0A7I4Y7K7_HAECO|nr:SAICAR synthetase and 1-(5-Phosphoribosyl)-5-amino-4-imidazole-carboxylate (AIR) carboxylase domain containing protein [Haemonchus contortus]